MTKFEGLEQTELRGIKLLLKTINKAWLKSCNKQHYFPTWTFQGFQGPRDDLRAVEPFYEPNKLFKRTDSQKWMTVINEKWRRIWLLHYGKCSPKLQEISCGGDSTAHAKNYNFQTFFFPSSEWNHASLFDKC